jgi:hypothetical protein
MKKLIKNYNSFLKESTQISTSEIEDEGPKRMFSKENKYKFQMEYDEDVQKKLDEYNFTFHTSDDNVDVVEEKNYIIIDVLNLTYSIEQDDNPDIRKIQPSRLDYILDNL